MGDVLGEGTGICCENGCASGRFENVGGENMEQGGRIDVLYFRSLCYSIYFELLNFSMVTHISGILWTSYTRRTVTMGNMFIFYIESPYQQVRIS